MTPTSAVTASPLAAEAATASPSPALLTRLTPEQRASILCVWERLPSYLHVVELHGPDWTPLAIEQLDDVLCDLADAFSKSKADFGSCSLMPFEISVPQGSAPVTSRPHRINPILAKEVDATLSQCLGMPDPALDLSVFKPAGGHLKEVWRRSDHLQRQEPQPDQQPQPVAHPPRGPGPDSLGKSQVFSIFDLVSSFHQITAHKDTVPLTAFCTPTGLYQ